MSENNENPDIPETSQEIDNTENMEDKEPVKETKNTEIILTRGTVRRSDKTQKETVKDCKKRAIEAFKHGQIDPEYRVVQMGNGKYRTYKRKTPLIQDPINVNQIQPNKPSNNDDETPEPTIKPKTPKPHNPFDDIVYYNMSNQISEQLNKRLDAVNAEIERLRHKNTKLKGKYKQLKQAIYITEEEEKDEPIHEQHEQQHEPEPIPQQQPQQPMPQQQQLPPLRRTSGINFNRFFN